jgi:hypothetical protein
MLRTSQSDRPPSRHSVNQSPRLSGTQTQWRTTGSPDVMDSYSLHSDQPPSCCRNHELSAQSIYWTALFIVMQFEYDGHNQLHDNCDTNIYGEQLKPAFYLSSACNETNLMHYLSSFYSVTIPLHVSSLLVAHHQEVTMYICDNWYVLYVLGDCQCTWIACRQSTKTYK